MSAIGDGSYMFGNPTPCHFVSNAFALPTLTVIFKQPLLERGAARQSQDVSRWLGRQTNHFPLTSLEPAPCTKESSRQVVDTVNVSRTAPTFNPPSSGPLRQFGKRGAAVLNMICKRPGNERKNGKKGRKPECRKTRSQNPLWNFKLR